MASCGTCDITGLFSIEYTGIISVNMSTSTEITLTATNVILTGPTTGTISMSAYPYTPGQDRLLGVSCPSSARAELKWIQKYDCFNNKMHFFPAWGGAASVSGDPISGVRLEREVVTYQSMNADASSGPASPYFYSNQTDGFNLIYTGRPIAINSGRPQSYNILSNVLPANTKLYLSSFDISIEPPLRSVVNYNFVFSFDLT
ncbi:MAG TPA: hypothetical protein ENI23_04805 [bacterium]|nr:hypothetical protein [bacterium]